MLTNFLPNFNERLSIVIFFPDLASTDFKVFWIHTFWALQQHVHEQNIYFWTIYTTTFLSSFDSTIYKGFPTNDFVDSKCHVILQHFSLYAQFHKIIQIWTRRHFYKYDTT